jgi:hypothetical protein
LTVQINQVGKGYGEQGCGGGCNSFSGGSYCGGGNGKCKVCNGNPFNAAVKGTCSD